LEESNLVNLRKQTWATNSVRLKRGKASRRPDISFPIRSSSFLSNIDRYHSFKRYIDVLLSGLPPLGG
jgi:hypothetical protein